MKSPLPTKRRFNLFAFAAETDTLFTLLMVAAIMLATQLSRVLITLFAPEITAKLQDLDVLAAVRGAALAQTMTTMLPLLVIPALLSSAIFGLANYIYRRHPNRVFQRKKVQLLSEQDAAVQQAVEALAALAGVWPTPTVVMPSGYKGASGQAFGFRDNYLIRLDGGLRVWCKKKTLLFRAVVLHELAHIVNGDIRRSYFAQALWTATVVISIAPLVLGVGGIVASGLFSGLLTGNLTNYVGTLVEVLILLFKTGVTIAMIQLIRARLLRTREVYADWRAALWGADASLKEIFQASSEKAPSGLGVWRLHPTSAERLEALNHPSLLFRLPWILPLLVGFLLAFVLGGSMLLLPIFYSVVLEPLRVARIVLGDAYQENPNLLVGALFWLMRGLWFVLFFAALVGFFAPIAWLLSGVLGSQLQKQTAADLVEKRRGLVQYLKLSIPATLLTLGLEIGLWAVPFSPFTPNSLGEIAVSFVFLIVMTLLVWWFLAYARFISLRIIAVATGPKPPKAQIRLIGWVLNGWLCVFFIPGLILGLIISTSIDEEWVSILLTTIAVWQGATLILSPIVVGVSWAITKVLQSQNPPRCAACRRVSRHTNPAVESCAYCGCDLGDWLFVSEENDHTLVSAHNADLLHATGSGHGVSSSIQD